jgi:5-methylcytosine-specific restriction endonuclease McrA
MYLPRRRTRRKRPKNLTPPRDQATLMEQRNRSQSEKAYYDRNLLAARAKRDESHEVIFKLEQKLSKLQEEDQRKSIIRSLLGTLSKSARQQADQLAAELTKLRRGKVFRFDGREFNIEALVRYCEAESRLRSGRIDRLSEELNARLALDARRAREREAAEQLQRKEEKRKQQAALAAAWLEKQRELAESVKRKLSRDHPCPYCDRELGVNPHADHIYPVSRGGLSVISNMVFVCQICNQKMGDMPIIDFAFAHSRDLQAIIITLRELGKKI